MISFDPITLRLIQAQARNASLTMQITANYPDGVDAVLTLSTDVFSFSVKTYFFGYNFECFLQDARAIESGKSIIATLLNLDQTLKLEFIQIKECQQFLSIHYFSYEGGLEEELAEGDLRAASALSGLEENGSQLVVRFMRLETPLRDYANRIRGLSVGFNLSTESPYPGNYLTPL